MKIDTVNWKPFQIDKMFNIYTGGDLIMGEITEGDIPIASNSAENNNIAAYTTTIPGRMLFDHTKSISIADRGKFWAFIQSKDFYIATRVKALVCKEYNILNIYQLSFIVSVLNQESFKFAYGRNCCANLPLIQISLPIQHNSNGSPVIDHEFRYSDEGFIPDWQWMEDYIKSLHHKQLTTQNKSNKPPKLNIEEWESFKVEKLFRIEPTKGEISDELIEGNDVPYIGAKHDMNGLMMSCRKEGFEEWISTGNCIIFIQLGAGSTGYANYVENDFIGMSGKTSCGYIDGVMNKYIGLFIATVLCAERPKYSFGRSWTGDRLNNTIIKLPILKNDDGVPIIDDTYKYSEQGYIPDWKWMESYIKSLPYGDRI